MKKERGDGGRERGEKRRGDKEKKEMRGEEGMVREGEKGNERRAISLIYLFSVDWSAILATERIFRCP